MRKIDADAIEYEVRYSVQEDGELLVPLIDVQRSIDNTPTLEDEGEWISVKDELPKLPDGNYGMVMVLATIKGEKESTVLFYERTVVRKKEVCRWKYPWDRICTEEITHWKPLPAAAMAAVEE